MIKRAVKLALRLTDRKLVRLSQVYDLDQRLKTTLLELDVDCVFDVGANTGQFATRLRALGYRGRIVSFEPNAAIVPALISSASSDQRWTVLPCALGANDGTLTLQVPENSQLASARSVSAYGRGAYDASEFSRMRSEIVDVLTLDGVFPSLQVEHGFERPFLKLDTQGYDIEVLRGARACIGRFVGLLSEVSLIPLYEEIPGIGESLETIRDAGFAVTDIFPVAHDREGALVEVDCLARRSRSR